MKNKASFVVLVANVCAIALIIGVIFRHVESLATAISLSVSAAILLSTFSATAITILSYFQERAKKENDIKKSDEERQ